jgi:hypothetical protein
MIVDERFGNQPSQGIWSMDSSEWTSANVPLMKSQRAAVKSENISVLNAIRSSQNCYKPSEAIVRFRFRAAF